MTRVIFIIALSLFTSVLFAQNSYEPLLCAGEIPEDFVTLFSEKYRADLSDIEGYSGSEKRDRQEFLLKSSYAIDGMLKGGQVLFNDSITEFINAVADEIYKYNDDLPAGMEFYALRSSATNAFSTSEKKVFVTTGLISQLENEAQLAFILCHEISHYIKEHTILGFLEGKERAKEKGSRRSYDEYVALMSKYSKSQETEADSEGLEYFKKTKYDAIEAITAFDVLHYSYLPFNEVPFDTDFFKSEYFPIRPAMKVDSINAIDVFNEDYDDSKSSHPNVWKRKQKVKTAIQGAAKGRWFIVGEDRFKAIQDISRKEGVRLKLIQGDYADAIYDCYLMSQYSFDDLFIKKSIAKALYGLQQHDCFRELRSVLSKTKYIEGESSALYHFLNELDSEELSVLAARHVYQVTQLLPDNEYFEDLLADIIYDMVNEREMHIDDFYTEFPEIVEAAATTIEPDSVSVSDEEEVEVVEERRERGGKYGIIEEAKEEYVELEEIEDENGVVHTVSVNGYECGFIDMLKDEEFNAYFQKVCDDYEEEEDRYDNMSYREKAKERKEESSNLKKVMKQGTSQGLDNAVIYSPFVYELDKNIKFEYIESEESEVLFAEKLSEYALEKGVNYTVSSFTNTSVIDTDYYNNMSRLTAWSSEAMSLEDKEVEMIPTESEYLYFLEDHLDGADKIVITGLVYFPEKRDIPASTYLYSALLYPTLPFVIAAGVTKKQHTMHYLKVFNLSDGYLIHRTSRDLKIKQNDKVISAVAYDTINQLSRERK